MVPRLYSSKNKLQTPPLISASQHYAVRCAHSPLRLLHMGGSVKTAEVRIVQFSLQSSQEFLLDKFHLEILTGST